MTISKYKVKDNPIMLWVVYNTNKY